MSGTSRAGRNARSEKRRRGPLLLTLTGVMLVAVSLGFYGAFHRSLYTARQDFVKLARQVQLSVPAVSDEAQPSPYMELLKQNRDLVGWIKIEQTTVDYPVVQTPHEPEYYLRRNFKKEYSIAGTPFLDGACEMEEGLLLILYGHNMNDGSMFAALQGYLDVEYWEDHSVIRCDSLTQAREYEVMAVLCFAATTEANEAYYTVPQNEEEFTEYVRRVRRDALYGTGLDAAWGQQLLALSTCDRRDSNARILVIARSMEE